MESYFIVFEMIFPILTWINVFNPLFTLVFFFFLNENVAVWGAYNAVVHLHLSYFINLMMLDRSLSKMKRKGEIGLQRCVAFYFVMK